MGLEEEFQILDPATQSLTQGFDPASRHGAAPASGADRRRADRVGDRGPPPRSGDLRGAARQLLLNRQELFTHAESQGYALGARARTLVELEGPARSSTRRTTGWSRSGSSTWPGATTRGAATPTSASAARTARSPSATSCADHLPHLLALSANSPSSRASGPSFTPRGSQTFVRMFPRCGVPDIFGSWAEHRRVLRAPGRDELHPGVHAGLVVGAAAPPLRHRRGAHLRRADRAVADAGGDGAGRRPRRLISCAGLRRGPPAGSRCRRATSRRTCGVRSATGSTARWSTSCAARRCPPATRAPSRRAGQAGRAPDSGVDPHLDAVERMLREGNGAQRQARGTGRREHRGGLRGDGRPGRAERSGGRPRRRSKSGRSGERGARAARRPRPSADGSRADGPAQASRRASTRSASAGRARRAAPPARRGPRRRDDGHARDGRLPEAGRDRADARDCATSARRASAIELLRAWWRRWPECGRGGRRASAEHADAMQLDYARTVMGGRAEEQQAGERGGRVRSGRSRSGA